LVGTTSSSSSTAGVKLYSQGTAAFVRSDTQVIYANRLSSDGDIAVFAKDGATVGSIFSSGGIQMGVGDGDTALLFADNIDAILPWSTSNVQKDNTIDLGRTATRFKDLYLSGSVVNPSGDLTVDVSGNISLDADGGSVFFKDAGTEFFKIRNTGSDVQIYSARSDADMKFEGVDGSVGITALRLDMSEAGFATFNDGISAKKHTVQTGGEIEFDFNGVGEHFTGGTSPHIFAGQGSTTTYLAGTLNFQSRQTIARDINFITGTTPAVALNIGGTGNVGIGTTSPLNKFVVAEGTGQHGVEIAPGTLSYIQAYDRATSDYGDLSIDAQTIRFATDNGTERMRITSGGDVSIGSGHSGFSGWRVLNMRQLSTGALINFEDDDGTRASTFASNGSALRYQTHIAGGYHNFETNTQSSALRITDAGNVGIGTTSPGEKLDVNGDARIRGSGSTIGGANISNAALLVGSSTAGMGIDTNEIYTKGDNLYLGVLDAEDHIVFRYNTTRLMDITTDGYVGIGTLSPLGRLHLKNGDASASHTYTYDSNGITVESDEPTIQIVAEDSGTHGGSLLWRYGNNLFAANANPTTDNLEFISGVTTGNNFDIHAGTNVTSYKKTLVIGADGNVGIGASSPLTTLHVGSNSGSLNTPAELFIPNGDALMRKLKIGHGASVADIITDDSSKDITFTVGGSERMRIDSSGNVIQGNNGTHSWTAINNTLFAAGGIGVTSNSDWGLQMAGSTTERIRFFTSSGGTGTVGNISVSTAGTTYTTTSDRRLKDNIQPIADATDKLMDMKPVTHTWIDNPEAPQVHGFIAQEMQEVIPEAISGDAESDEMMSMDYGRITPVIVAALQDALNEIKELKTRIDELENN